MFKVKESNFSQLSDGDGLRKLATFTGISAIGLQDKVAILTWAVRV